jgi:hypothetical protein
MRLSSTGMQAMTRGYGPAPAGWIGFETPPRADRSIDFRYRTILGAPIFRNRGGMPVARGVT